MQFPLFIHSHEPLTSANIVQQLHLLRAHASAPLSDYHVAAIAEVDWPEEGFFYTFGVNVEIAHHNRLGIHGEQNAIVSALTTFGSKTKFTKVWIMAAPANASSDAPPKPGKSCGHCRQIMVSLAAPNAEIYAVALNGQFLAPDSFENGFLPDAFSEHDVPTEIIANQRSRMTKQKLAILERVNAIQPFTENEIVMWLKSLTPHIISPNFQTSPITACILQCNYQGYAAGVLVQDVAFLTTDAVFAAIGNAITRFGNSDLEFTAIYLTSANTSPAQFSATEIQVLNSYINDTTAVSIYTPNGESASYRFSECRKTGA